MWFTVFIIRYRHKSMALMVTFTVNFVISYEGCSSQHFVTRDWTHPASTRNFTQTQ